MGKHPVLRPREVAAILEKLGFVSSATWLAQTVSTHGRPEYDSFLSRRARDISPILLRQIAKDIGLSVEEMLQNR